MRQQPSNGRRRSLRLRARGSRATTVLIIAAVYLVAAGAVTGNAPAIGNSASGRTVTADNLSAIVQPPGIGVQAAALMHNGDVRTLRVETSALGRVLTSTAWGPPSSAASVGAAGNRIVGPCRDRAYQLTGSWWRTRFDWWFRAESAPKYLARPRVRAALRRAASNITRARNTCGRADRVSATHRLMGNTSSRPGATRSGRCLQPDGMNVIAFSDLGPRVVGFTCWWFRGSVTIEADMILNKGDFRWTVNARGCTTQYIVEPVATHEFGHVFGLGHVSELQHPYLTMSEGGVWCDASASTLGRGDLLGLERRY
jgi:hypothetical protein